MLRKKQKEIYDRKHIPLTLTKGTEVLLENTKEKQRKGGKLEKLWLGPYTIHTHIRKGVYELQNKVGHVMKKKANISRLKIYEIKEGEVAVGTKEDEEVVVGTKEDEEVVVGAKEDEEFVVGTKEDEEVVVGTKEDEAVVVETNEDEAVVVGAKEDEEFVVGTKEDEEVVVGTKEDEEVVVWSNGDAVLVGSKREAVVGSMEGEVRRKRKGDAIDTEELKSLKHTKLDEPVVIGSIVGDMQDNKPWVVVGSVRLFADKKEILSSGQWLTDTLIHAAQMLIKNDEQLLSIEGLQNPLYGPHMKFEAVKGEFIPILHSGGNHWITILAIVSEHCRVRVYDSLNTDLPLSTKKLIASMLNCSNTSFTLNMPIFRYIYILQF